MASSSPSQSFSKRELYGGAITVELPSDFIDSSTIRQIPDHQEVHLSPQTLTSLIFEINAHQSQLEIQSQIQTSPETQSIFSNPSLSLSLSSLSPSEKQDIKASIYHFLDPILPPDEVDTSSQSQSLSNIISPKKIKLGSRSLSSFPAYLSSGTVISAEVDKDASSALPREWAQNPVMKRSEIRVYQLLVRMEKYGTDFCVRINVPLKEFVGDKGKESEELSMVEEIMRKIVSTMDIADFGLFGEED